ncbi:uncharacterized protein LOC108914802 [Anoplophora glabripennis]|uniref:uncharacterized protein LOC108914802 n=1 Tax=Anoplophora glabripennis TaxID=217634 RepID=UPI00087475DE|nr:uncharacterized protein LOC108914802 [Anoplophora glabripennis]
MESRYEATVAKTARLRENGYEVIEMWECEFKNTLTPEIESYAENHRLLSLLPLNPRDAFYGGRTGATKLYYKVKEDEKIKYVDVCSLYPWVNKYGKYPVGHPEVILGDDCNRLDLNKTDGIIKCKILPPQELYHPVLPLKSNNKLMFPLCRTCCQHMSDECEHTEDERALTGTWVIDEVLKSLEKGYKIVEIYEIWKYKIEQYNPNTKSGGLFADYISTFLKLKQQASGLPTDCNSDEKKEKYIKDYFEREGVRLEPKEIEFNPGLRQVGKSVITSFWGKLGQRENQMKTSIVKDPSEFFDLLSGSFVEVHNIYPINENVLIVNWMYKEEAYDPLPTVNVALAAYTTAQARLKLYSYLEMLEDRVLYYDTDSIIYISKPNTLDIPLGSFLGEMTDELEEYGQGSFITQFVSGGPKLYAYRVYLPEKNEYHDTIKAKGITINHKTSKTVNFEKLRDMVLDDAPPEYISTKNILRTQCHEVITKEITKVFRTNFRKRRRVGDYDSVPFGYKRSKLETS